MNAATRFVVGLASAGHLMCHGSQILLAQGQREAAALYGVEVTDVAWAITAFTLGMGLTAIPAGLAADRWGPARVLNVYFAVVAAVGLLCGLAPGFATFFASHALLGGAAGMYHPSGLSMISFSAGREELGPALGIHGVFGNVGAASAPALVLAMHAWWNVRGAFLAVALVAAVTALVMGALRRRGVVVDRVVEHAAAHSRTRRRSGLLALLAAMSLNGFLFMGFMTLYPETLKNAGGFVWSPGLVSMGILALGGLGQFLGGHLSRGGREARLYLVMLVVQPLLLVAMALGLAAPHGAGAALLPVLLFAGFSFVNYLTQPVENHLVAGYTSTARRSTAFGMKFLANMVVGAPAAGVAAELAARSGPTAAYGLLAAVGLVGLGSGVWFVRSIHHAVEV